MELEITLSPDDVRLIKILMRQQEGTKFLRFRAENNLSHNKTPITAERFWRTLVCMRLTSRQKSGPNSPVSQLIQMTPFPLSLSEMRNNADNRGFVVSTLSAVSGLRDYNVAADQFEKNFKSLEAEGWKSTLDSCNTLLGDASIEEERNAARYLMRFEGIGPKQSRNILQALCLTRYEIPLDSRVIQWLKDELRFPIPVSTSLLSDSAYYDFVMTTIQKLCGQAGVFPCMLDAAIFSKRDPDTWTEEMMRF